MTILIPAYNPDEKLLKLLAELQGQCERIVLVNDGSTVGKDIFEKARPMVDAILVHEVNRGKGAALKTGFNHIKDDDVITADADGQHTPQDIAKVAEALKSQREGLVLGVREFSGKVPFRSLFGNMWTRWVFFFMTGLMIRDTQTGLRGIPKELLSRVAEIPGDRYEYEMAMLADCKHHLARPVQVGIQTIYIEGNATSHFNPLLDTIRIYRSLIQFCVSSVASFFLDNVAFAVAIGILDGTGMVRKEYTLLSLIIARLVSSNFNYLYNRLVVFKTKGRVKRSFVEYWMLVLLMGAFSYAFTQSVAAALDFRGVSITLIKIVVESFLFFVSYKLQKRFIFKSKVDKKQ